MSKIDGIDHVQLPIPFGGLDRARAFYAGLLGLGELREPSLDRPGTLRFGVGGQRLELSEGRYCGDATQAHLALRVHQVGTLAQRLASAGQLVDVAPLSVGTPRVYVEDPFGNRLELIEAERVHHGSTGHRHDDDIPLAV